MAELRIPKELISLLFGKNGLNDFFVMINYNEVQKAIAYVRSKTPEGIQVKFFDQDWAYFTKIWMKKSNCHDDKSGIFCLPRGTSLIY